MEGTVWNRIQVVWKFDVGQLSAVLENFLLKSQISTLIIELDMLQVYAIVECARVNTLQRPGEVDLLQCCVAVESVVADCFQ